MVLKQFQTRLSGVVKMPTWLTCSDVGLWFFFFFYMLLTKLGVRVLRVPFVLEVSVWF